MNKKKEPKNNTKRFLFLWSAVLCLQFWSCVGVVFATDVVTPCAASVEIFFFTRKTLQTLRFKLNIPLQESWHLLSEEKVNIF